MMRDKKKQLARQIIYLLPNDQKPVQYLIDTLGIVKESAYRRLRGEVSFSFEEIVTLSKVLGFSIDELVNETSTHHALFNLSANTTNTQEEVFINMLLILADATKTRINMSNQVIYISLNKIYPFFFTKHQNMLKFFYFEYLHQIMDISTYYHFCDTVVPPRVIELCNSISYETIKQSDFTIVISNNLFINTMQKIQYYYHCNLITDQEMGDIREDLLAILDEMEADTHAGVTASGGKFDVYISPFNVAQSSINISYENRTKSFFYVDPINMMSTSNPELCAVHRRWFDSLKRYATYISSSNQAMRSDFFGKQRKYIGSY
ncbi:MAG: hypothetical protein LBN06_04265 [Prevotellaceae bacterium]|jgi:hypothetical protein|nr:hypothetical protein [Prevotellaceae bacterium]